MTRPQGPAAAGGDRARAGDADRERVIEALKDAFVRGRLTRDELGTRAGQALSARTHADLAALTADLPPVRSFPVVTGWAPPLAPARRRPLARAAARSSGCLAVATAAVWLAFLADPAGASPDPYSSLAPGFLFLAYVAVCAALGFALYGVYASLEERRSRRQVPPRSGPPGRARQGEWLDGTGRDPAPPGPGAASRAHRSRERRQYFSARPSRAPRGMKPAPGAA